MSTTLTIRNLDEGVKQKLRLRAASHQRSMEAEARDILAKCLAEEQAPAEQKAEIKERRRRLKAVVGIWENRYQGKSTDEIMKELRADD
jgi:plasmid stability protein